MDQILHAFGIDWRLIVIQIFNFAILAGLLWYFLYTPILKVLNERQQKVEKGVKDAEAAEKSLQEAGSEKSKIVTNAHSEASEIVDRAKKHADEKGAVIVSDAQGKADRIMSDAKDKGEELKEQAKKESEAEVARLAILAAEKVLQEKLS